MSAVGAARVQMTVIITTRKSSVMGHVGHGSRGSWVTWVMGHVCHGSRGSWVTWVMGHVGHGSRGSWVSSLGHAMRLIVSYMIGT